MFPPALFCDSNPERKVSVELRASKRGTATLYCRRAVAAKADMKNPVTNAGS